MDSGSTPGNPYVSEREGLDIFQKVPYNMPIMRRSTRFHVGAHWNKDSTQTDYLKLLGWKLAKKPNQKKAYFYISYWSQAEKENKL